MMRAATIARVVLELVVADPDDPARTANLQWRPA